MSAVLMPPSVPLSERMRSSLFASPGSSAVTAVLCLAFAVAVWKLIGWGLWNAAWQPDAQACREAAGACWGIVAEKHRLVLLGRYPQAEAWRPVLASVLLLASVGVAALPRFFGRAGAVLLVAGLASFVVLMGGGWFRLAPVTTDLWGGLPLTLFLTVLACLAGVPLGIALALGRRSQWPLVRWFCTGYIELIRGLPLITLLFFGAFVLPLLLPPQLRVDPMIRIAACLVAFVAAYLAEVFRGGLQAIPRGQYHAAMALGMTRWQMLRLVILPQSLRLTIAPTVSTFIGALKDTSLVAVVNIYDLTGSLKLALGDVEWSRFFVELYIMVCGIYLVIGLALARYGRFLERRYALDARR